MKCDVGLLLAVGLIFLLIPGSRASAQPDGTSTQGNSGDSTTAQGNSMITLGGSGSSFKSLSFAAGYGYFVIDDLMPGARYTFALQKASDGAYTYREHEVTLFVRYHLPSFEHFYPFVTPELAYHHKYLEYSGYDPDVYDFFSVFGGAGLVLKLGPHFGVEATIGARKYLGAYEGAVDDDFAPEWRFGFGYYP